MKIADYKGKLLNHVETLYRPGEREIAIKIAEALGCAITDTGFTGGGDETFLAVHPNPDDRNMENNAFYMSPMRPEQQAVEDRLKRLSDEDADLQQKLAAYRSTAKSAPFGIPHFAIRYPTGNAVQLAVDQLTNSVAPLIGERLHIRVFRPEDADAAGRSLIQAFVYQDVIVSGSFLHGQLIELQSRNI